MLDPELLAALVRIERELLAMRNLLEVRTVVAAHAGVETRTSADAHGGHAQEAGAHAQPLSGDAGAKPPYLADFVLLWAIWPKKIDRQRALRAYQVTRRGRRGQIVPAADIQRAAEAYVAVNGGTDVHYLKHLATFLGPDEPWREYLEADKPKPLCSFCHSGEHMTDDCPEWRSR